MTGFPGLRRGLVASVLAVVGGVGLGVQVLRPRPGTDQLGTVAYVVALGLLVVLVAPKLCPWLVAAIAAAVAIGIEAAQLTGVPAAIGRAVPPLRYLLGSSFSATDVAWSLVGGVATWGTVRVLRATVTPRRHWSRGALVTGLAGIGLLVVSFAPLPRIAIRYGQSAPWLPVAALLVAVAVGLVETWRGLSRDDRRLSGSDLAGRAMVALGLAGVAAVLGRGLVTGSQRWSPTPPLAIVVVEILVLTAILAVVAGWGLGAPQRTRTTAAFLLAGLAVTLAAVAPAPVAAPRPSAPVPSRIPVAQTRPPVPVSPTTQAAPEPDAPAAPDSVPLCRVERLTAHTMGWDMAMGKTWVSVVVRNTSSADCAVAGLPEISLLQGRTPLGLTISRESARRPGTAELPRRALARAGGTVSVLLWWPGYRNAADQTTPQALTLHAPGVGSIPVALDRGPAPFDLKDGGLVRVSAWL